MPQSDFWPFGKRKPTENLECGHEAALQKQLGEMEGEVKEMQMELAAIRRDQTDLSLRKPAKAIVVPQVTAVPHTLLSESHMIHHEERLHKYPEISKLREDLMKAKNEADDERCKRETYETKLKDLEEKLNNICSTGVITDTKESRKFSDEEVSSLKMQIREMKEEAEELNINLTDKTEQLQEYRIKYLHAQQQVEELKRQLDVIEFDNKQVSDQIQIEIQKMKMQFQQKLQELAPLPDLLKGAQMQLQEAKQLQMLAEDSSHQFSNELVRVKEKLVVAVCGLNQEKVEKNKVLEENETLSTALDAKRLEVGDLGKNVENYKSMVMRLEEKLMQQETLLKEKSIECSQFLKDLEELKEESSRSLSRSKERAESMRRFMHTQVTELERQLIQSRAQCKACQKERDDMRQRMQIQIGNLQENFELVELRLRALQGQVTSLKNSYTVILADEEECTSFNNSVTT